jgi:hypothetical protein
MYVRLGFAMAAHLDPDILLVDEVLSVGDASFQGRCFNRISELKRAGTTIVLISHDLGSVERLSDRAVLLDHGRLVVCGRPADVITEYQRRVDGESAPAPERDERRVRILQLAVLDAEGRETSTARTGEPLRVAVRLLSSAPAAPVVDVFFYSYQDGDLQAQCSSDGTPALADVAGAGECTIEFDVPVLGLQPGAYTIGATVRQRAEGRPADWNFGRATLYVTEGRGVGGRFFMPHTVRVRNQGAPAEDARLRRSEPDPSRTRGDRR